MPTEVILPKVDMDMATGRISKWFFKDGDKVKTGDVLFEIETDKAAMEIDSPATGTLGNVVGAEGVDIPVGEPVAWIFAEGETPTASAVPAGSSNTGPTTAPAPANVEALAPAITGGGAQSVASATGSATRATPLARRLARQNNVNLSALSGSGPKGRVQAKDVEAALAGGSTCAAELPRAARDAAWLSVAAERSNRAGSAWLRSEGSGAPLVLIHGFGSETASWRPLLSAFYRQVPVLSVELPGHGGAVEVAANSFDDLVAHVEAELSARGVSAAHIAGHSLGAAVATAVASGKEVEARSLFLIAPAGMGPEINTGFTNGFAAARDENAVSTWLRELVSDPRSISDGFMKATARARADGRLSEAQMRLAGILFSQSTQLFSVRRLLDRLAMPVRVVVGAADKVVPFHHAQGMPGHVAVHTFDGVGHMPQLEVRDTIARLLEQTLGH